MARTYRSRQLAILRDNERAMSALFADLAARASAEVSHYADAEGNVPVSRTWQIQEAVGALVMALFIGRGPSGQDAPFIVQPNGAPLPLAPYPRTLLNSIQAALLVQAERQQAIMQRYVPADVAQAIALRAGPASLPPLSGRGYTSPMAWIDPAGRTLSDRIWRTGGVTRRKLDALLDDMIAEGRGSQEIAREVEQFLQPGRNTIRTRKPYGRDASFDAMRLARTEISTNAHNAATAGAQLNPFVQEATWNLSGSHPEFDICDRLAADSPYPVNEIPAIPHPQCLCYITYNTAGKPSDIVDQLRAEMQAGSGPLLDTSRLLLRPDRFVQAMMREGV